MGTGHWDKSPFTPFVRDLLRGDVDVAGHPSDIATAKHIADAIRPTYPK